MALRISNTGLLTKHTLTVLPDGIKFCESAFFGGTRHFRFADIACILLSADSKLSFQVRNEVFSIPVKPGNTKHQQVIAAFVGAVQRAKAGGTAVGG